MSKDIINNRVVIDHNTHQIIYYEEKSIYLQMILSILYILYLRYI